MWTDHYSKTAAAPMDNPLAKGVTMRILIGDNRGAPNFIMRLFEVQPGGHSPRHSHAFEHEIFVLDGKASIFGGGAEKEAGPGFAVFIPGNEEHQIRNAGDSVLRFLCLIPKSGG